MLAYAGGRPLCHPRRAEAASPSFQYVVKASQMYTHRKRLNVDEFFVESWQRFWARAQRLRPHLGPVLFQFPQNFSTTSMRGKETVSNISKLCRLGEVLPPGERFVFEFRHVSWYCQEVYDVLRQHDWCLALVNVAGEEPWFGTLRRGCNPPVARYPLDCCSWGVYVRYHGSTGQYEGAYGRRAMEHWAEHTRRWLGEGREVWHAFNNTDDGVPPSAIEDCRSLAAALRANGVF